MDKAELIRNIRQSHEGMSASVGRISDARLLQPAMGTWTGKDVISHLAWWQDHSARVVEALRAGREPYDGNDPANSTDARNERTYREHLDDPPGLTRRAFSESFDRLMAALDPVTDEDLFAGDRWPWLEGEALMEMILWDTSRHYDAHRESLERLLSET